MSKSLGNFFTVRDLVDPEDKGGKNIDPLAVRMTLMSGHYRKPFNFTLKTLKGNVRHRERLDEILQLVGDPEAGAGGYSGSMGKPLQGMYNRALDAMTDDLNTPSALTALFGGTKMILSQSDQLDEENRGAVCTWLRDMNDLLGVVYVSLSAKEEEEDPLSEKVDPLLQERKQARSDGNWARADEIRDELAELGVEIMDTSDGTKWKRKGNL